MSMTKRYLESLPEEEQNEILGEIDIEHEEEWDAHEGECNIRNFVSGDMDEDDLTRRLVEDGILSL